MLAFTSSFAAVLKPKSTLVEQRRPKTHRARARAVQAAADQPAPPAKEEAAVQERKSSAPKTAWDLLRVIAASGIVLLGIFIFDAVFGIAAFGIAIFGAITVLFGARRAVRWRTNIRKKLEDESELSNHTR